MSKDTIDFLRHIRDECDYILSVIPPDNGKKDDFMGDETLKRAVVRSLEIIGEATKKIQPEEKSKWNEVEWRNMAGMRDRLIHDYMGINYQIVWDVATNKIPLLYKQIVKIIDKNG